jgi:hypothetical protein
MNPEGGRLGRKYSASFILHGEDPVGGELLLHKVRYSVCGYRFSLPLCGLSASTPRGDQA